MTPESDKVKDLDLPRNTVHAREVKGSPLDNVKTGQWYWVKGTKRVRIPPGEAGYVNFEAEVEEDEDDEVEEDGLMFPDEDDDDEVEEVEDDEVEEDPDPGFRNEEYEWFGCVTHIGSNFIKVESPGSYLRVHFDKFFDWMRKEPDPDKVLAENVATYQAKVRALLIEVKTVTDRLGVSKRSTLGHDTDDAPGTSLAIMSGTADVNSYKNALVKAKDKELPNLFKEIRKNNEKLAEWMSAGILPMKAEAEKMRGSIGDIEDRIFNVSLYAGLIEDVKCVKKGKPAEYEDALHVMQRRLYMDEECLANYDTGGMDFKNIRAFDRWLCRKDNLERTLPFPRCMVAFRVRRNTKERDWDGGITQAFVNFHLEQADKKTFLYIRNGQQVHRLTCEIEFGESIFPDKADFDPSEPMMVKVYSSGHIDEIMPTREFEARIAKQEEKQQLHDEWEKANPGKDRWDNPHHVSFSFSPGDWEPFDHSSVYFDDALKEVSDKIKHYNRIAVIIQGLFDRSEVLHPHAPAKLWEASNFSAVLTLVYDGSNVFHDGDLPDFEAYRAACNALLDEGCVTIGQEDYWEEREAVKENARRDRNWRFTGDRYVKRWTPYGNDGPSYLAKVAKWSKRRKRATYSWHRRRLRDSWPDREGDLVECSQSVPAAKLFNISAYRPGDYKQFFNDCRTREKYLKWAPMLMAAEEYHAGNLKIGNRRLKKKRSN